MNRAGELFDYLFIDNQSEKTLFLLHGTGGAKDDFIFLDKLLNKKYNLVGLQGNINEHGLTRFFKRHSLGIFDQENIKIESAKLKNFISAWIKKHKLKTDQLVFLGYSNGANLLLATLFYYPRVLKNLVLLHPMLPFAVKKKSLDLSKQKFFISCGKYDQIISPEDKLKLVSVLTSNKANLTQKEYPSGHEITNEEISEVVKFLDKI